MVVEFLKKIVKSLKSMFNENNLAAAQIAQIFGSELLKVQQNAQTDSGHQPEIVRLNPKQFLMNGQSGHHGRRVDEQRLFEALQREAEAMCPLPVEHHPVQLHVQPPVQPIAQQTSHVSKQESVFNNIPLNEIKQIQHVHGTDVNSSTLLVLERIATSLERIASIADRFDVKLDIKPKRKTIKRKIKSSKPILLNETTS